MEKPERRAQPRFNGGKLNYESMMAILHRGDDFPPWKSLTPLERAAYSSAAAAVVHAAFYGDKDDFQG